MDNEAVRYSGNFGKYFELYNFQVYKSDINDLQKELDFIKKSFDKEKMKNAELEGLAKNFSFLK